jgi:hypothetical protein
MANGKDNRKIKVQAKVGKASGVKKFPVVGNFS